MDTGIIVSTIGVFIQVIFDKYLSSKLEQWAVRANLGCEFQNLRRHLEMAQAILETLKGSTVLGEGICQLAQELKASAYDAADVLDELDYLRLMDMVEDRSKEKVAGSSRLSFPSALQSVFHQSGALVLPPFKRARQDVDSVPSDWDTVSCKMKSIAESLQRTAANIERVAQLKNLVAINFQKPQFPSSRQTSSLLTEEDFYGRDEEKNAIINMLLEPNRNRYSEHKRFSVLPVVGIGGVGKTTIVQYVYNDPTIMNSFEVRAWACVSGFLDVKQVTIDILQSIDEEANDQFISSRSLDNIQTLLVKKLKKRKFLIVLDDVWSSGNWELMCAPFTRGAHESKIIVTTRRHDIAYSVGNFAPPITLRGLEDDPFWTFFKQKAFGDDNIFDNLALIGRKIANKLNGIPLAAKTIGKLLHKQLTSEHWTSILDSNLWELRQGPEDIMPALLLSYQHLPPNVQRCFAFCSAYPKDHKVSEEELTYSWMAHGFIQAIRRDKTMEDIAKEYFNELVSASFFEALANDNRYRMHGLLHDLACSVAQDECFITNNNLSRVGDLIHLRYLDLRFSGISELPESVCKLYHLQVLDVLAGYAGIPYIGKLTSLQELDQFNVTKDEAFNIKQLKNLREMGRSLSIEHLENVANREEASQSGLKEKYRLNELNLVWSSNWEDRDIDAGAVLRYTNYLSGEELHFEEMPAWHSCLRLVPIEQWSGQVPSIWFPRLSTLCIQNCPNLDPLPPLPHASTLSRISLKNVGTISSMELEDEDIVICFVSNLRLQKQYYLKFHNLRRLKSFSISSCGNFAVLPWKDQGERVIPEVSTTMNDINISLPSINGIKICGSGISEDILHEIFTNAGFLDCLSIKFCPQITSIELTPEIRLEYLLVEDCLQLRSLNCRQTLVRLRELTVLRSPKFVEGWKSLIQQTEGPHQEIFASLKRLHIDDSSFLAVPICRTLGYLRYLIMDSDQQIVHPIFG
ncbi:hypothetical protein U9M48_020980 [Paspalum notatum var. saurae]|uniref:Uncharacterized protein n=1 Tax=Paspalum notatum var. saurae TaxID=547442 RepID=A0AAQ3TFW1_PASNO